MMLESLEELRVFAQIIESGSMSRAAKALGMPANTVSRRLAALEERVGVRLLNRTTRSISLNEAGRAVLARAHRILQEAEAVELDLRQDKEGLQGLLRVSVPSLLSADVLSAIKPLLLEHEGLQIQVHVHDKPINPVAAGLDVSIIGGRLSDSSLSAKKMGDVRPLLAASEAYLSERGRPETPNDLSAHDAICFLSDPPMTGWTLTDVGGAQHRVPFSARVMATDGRTVMDAIRQGLGIGMTSPRILRASPELRHVLPSYTMLGFPVYAIFPTARQHSARLRAFLAAAREAIQA
ncbi:MAG: LysR family transcriptional regulator [Alphaproteobacteria bacterium]|nr:LysR family transcriptional regulator [Alphaproteobacteria bacterium]